MNQHSSPPEIQCWDDRLLDSLWLSGAGSQRSLFGNLVPKYSFQTSSKTKRIGKYFEALVYHFLDIHPDFDLLETGKQLKDTSKTIGEVDCLLLDRIKQEYIHLEIAIKFYLAIEIDGCWKYVGPNPSDNLTRKLNHMHSHQLSLLETPAGKAFLSQSGLSGISFSKAFLLKGMFYYPIGVEPIAPKSSNPAHLCGWWTRYSACRNVLFQKNQSWLATAGGNYLAEIKLHPDLSLLSNEQAFEHVRNKVLKEGKPTPLSQFRKNQDGFWKSIVGDGSFRTPGRIQRLANAGWQNASICFLHIQ